MLLFPFDCLQIMLDILYMTFPKFCKHDHNALRVISAYSLDKSTYRFYYVGCLLARLKPALSSVRAPHVPPFSSNLLFEQLPLLSSKLCIDKEVQTPCVTSTFTVTLTRRHICAMATVDDGGDDFCYSGGLLEILRYFD